MTGQLVLAEDYRSVVEGRAETGYRQDHRGDGQEGSRCESRLVAMESFAPIIQGEMKDVLTGIQIDFQARLEKMAREMPSYDPVRATVTLDAFAEGKRSM